MPDGPRVVLENACYHLIARGNQKQRVFKNKEDYKSYLHRIKRYKKRYGFRLYGFCLMPNHIHLIGKVGEAKCLAKFMQCLTRSYTAYFNEKYQEVGHLWQGRFKSKIIIKDRYLIDCVNYIELNPVRANIAGAPQEYGWSSHRERNLGIDKESRMLDALNLQNDSFLIETKTLS